MKIKDTGKVDVLKTSIWKALFTLAWPIILTNMMQAIYNITDAYFLGKLGPLELSVPTVIWPLIFVFISFATGFSYAGTSLIAQYTGYGDQRRAEKSAAQTILVMTFVALSIMAIVLIFSKQLLSLLRLDENIFELSHTYLKIMAFSLPFSFLMQTVAGIFRGWGNSFIALKYNGISILLNVALDPLFIFQFNLGVFGAALATMLSQVIMSVVFLIVLFRGREGFKLHAKDFVPDPKLIKKVLVVGLPSSIGESFTAIGFAIIMGVIAQFGPIVISGYGIGNRMNNLITMFAMGISLATATMTGQYVGANQPEKAEETVKKASLATLLIVGSASMVMFLFGHNITKFFINDPEVIKVGEEFFRYVSFSLPFFSLVSVFLGTLRGTGHTIQSTIIDITRLWGIRVPLVFFFAETHGYIGVFIAMIISNFSALLLALGFLIFGNWKRPVIEEASQRNA
ncbi:hypothetical protein NAAC61_08900 [Petrotoga sp. 8T1HF07.NaAc.6.1]|uniref:MATE family efflux transporter n=1 Tax=Petrotoga sp. 8T1HF07.NaAc.6.1 TaxID=1351838 RepID=UPI00192C6D9D|nr:MATE family efflux transporter [Petrotoga sp. 8T1HF07.NaAc.6.1]MBL5982113.1 hypothetical protein [Petrotoga sp. 8T1HF07.NaAc.6.1]